jgi:hypothetical protein
LPSIGAKISTTMVTIYTSLLEILAVPIVKVPNNTCVVIEY